MSENSPKEIPDGIWAEVEDSNQINQMPIFQSNSSIFPSIFNLEGSAPLAPLTSLAPLTPLTPLAPLPPLAPLAPPAAAPFNPFFFNPALFYHYQAQQQNFQEEIVEQFYAAGKNANPRRNQSPDHVRRPMNAFMVWSKTRRKELAAEYPGKHNAELSRLLGQEWKQMTPNTKAPFIEIADNISRKHKAEHPDYRYRPRRKLKVAGQPTDFASIVELERRRRKSEETNDCDGNPETGAELIFHQQQQHRFGPYPVNFQQQQPLLVPKRPAVTIEHFLRPLPSAQTLLGLENQNQRSPLTPEELPSLTPLVPVNPLMGHPPSPPHYDIVECLKTDPKELDQYLAKPVFLFSSNGIESDWNRNCIESISTQITSVVAEGCSGGAFANESVDRAIVNSLAMIQ